jgi:hypothetical protein
MKRLASAPLTPPTIEEAEGGVECDRIEPGDEAAAKADARNGPEDVEKDFLHHILRIGTRPEEPVCTPEDRRRVALDEFLVGCRSVGQLTPGSVDEWSVRIFAR